MASCYCSTTGSAALLSSSQEAPISSTDTGSNVSNCARITAALWVVFAGPVITSFTAAWIVPCQSKLPRQLPLCSCNAITYHHWGPSTDCGPANSRPDMMMKQLKLQAIGRCWECSAAIAWMMLPQQVVCVQKPGLDATRNALFCHGKSSMYVNIMKVSLLKLSSRNKAPQTISGLFRYADARSNLHSYQL